MRIRNRIGMRMSPETAEWVSDFSNWALLASLVVGVAATFFLVVSSNVKEEALKKELLTANERIATLGKEAEGLKAQAEADRLARIKIEEKLAPRTLTGEQQLVIIETIKPFAPQAFEFVSYQDDQEVVQLVHTLVRLLVSAGWKGFPATGFLMAQLEVGIRIEFSPEGEKQFAPAANALADALNAEGIATSVGVREKLDKNDRVVIRSARSRSPTRASWRAIRCSGVSYIMPD